MANYATLKAAIQQVIKQNGNNEITGSLLQQSLLSMINSLGVGFQYLGIATPTSNPGTPDQNVFYFALTSGTYTNYGGIVVDADEICILKYNGTWLKDSFPAATKEQMDAIRNFVGMPFSTISWSGAQYNVNNVPLLLSGQKYYLKINSVSPETRVSITVSYNGSNSQFIGNIGIGADGIEIIPDGNKNQITAYLVDASTGAINYSVSAYGLAQEITKIEAQVAQNTSDISDLTQEVNEYENANDTKVNTINAQQYFDSNLVNAVAGTDYYNRIPINIPKGELFSAIAIGNSGIVGGNELILRKNDIDAALAYLQLNTWSVIKADADIFALDIFKYRTVVTGSGAIEFKIKKLQSMTRDGILPLYDGGLAANGTTWANANRKTTRVIFNSQPLFLKVNAPYEVAYMYGDEPDNLTDGGYVPGLSGGGSAILNVSAKYIGFTIVKPSTETFDDLRFIVANNESNDAKISKDVNNVLRESMLGVNAGSSLFPFVQGLRSFGIFSNATNRISSQIINFAGKITIDKNVGDGISILPYYRAKGTTNWVEISGWTQRLSYTGDGEFYIVLSYDNNADITPAEAYGVDSFIENSPSEIQQYPQYEFSIIGHAGTATYYDEPGIILRKNRRYSIKFNGVLASEAASGQILNVGAFNVNDPEQAISIAYRTAGSTTIPSDIIIALPYDAFIRSENRLSKNSYVNATVVELTTSVARGVQQMVPDADKTNIIANSLKCKQFLTGDLLTTVKDILVYGSGIDIIEGGEFYLGIMWAENAASETGNPEYNTGLIIGNILDPYGTKERYTAALFGDAIFDGVGYDQITGETLAKKINDNEIAVFTCGYYVGGKVVAATKIFNLTTKQFGAFQKCYINVTANGSNHRYQIKEDETTVREIHQLTGMHNWDDVPAISGGNFTFFTNSNPRKIGDWFYLMMNIGEYAPALVRTQDFIEFYYVCELPFGTYKEISGQQTFIYNPTEEVDIALLNNRLFATCRGNKGRFSGATEGTDYYGYNQIMSANFDDVLANNAQWTIVNLEPYWYEKPSLVAFNERLYLLTGARGTWSYKGVEGVNLNRFKHMFFVFDRNMNILKRELMNPDDGWLHPTFQNYGNSVYSVNCTDVRNYTFFGTGNNRSELRLKRLDMTILDL